MDCRLKTGNVPPPDYPFEEMKTGGELNYQTLHKKSRKGPRGPSREMLSLFKMSSFHALGDLERTESF